jgi:hypothetical protein
MLVELLGLYRALVAKLLMPKVVRLLRTLEESFQFPPLCELTAEI